MSSHKNFLSRIISTKMFALRGLTCSERASPQLNMRKKLLRACHSSMNAIAKRDTIVFISLIRNR